MTAATKKATGHGPGPAGVDCDMTDRTRRRFALGFLGGMSKGLSPATPATRTGVSTKPLRRSFGAANDRDLRQECRVAKQGHAKKRKILAERDHSRVHSGFGCRK